MAHGQWTQVEARGVLGAWKRSGLGVEAFARSLGLASRRLYYYLCLEPTAEYGLDAEGSDVYVRSPSSRHQYSLYETGLVASNIETSPSNPVGVGELKSQPSFSAQKHSISESYQS